MALDQPPDPDSPAGTAPAATPPGRTAAPAPSSAAKLGPNGDPEQRPTEHRSTTRDEPAAPDPVNAAADAVGDRQGQSSPDDTIGPRPSRWHRLRRLILRVFGIGILGSLGLVGLYRFLPPPVTPLMLIRLVEGNGIHKDWVSYEEISPNLARAVIASEDSGFCSHNGFDWTALDQAWSRNQTHKRIRGGSTISNQTAKNVFLWPDRTYLRKGVEFYFTVLIEALWGKKRILEMYLNVVEWGPGIYGAEGAARSHFKKPAQALTRHEAALLAAVLPNPLHWSPSKPSAYIRGRAGTIEARMADIADPTGDPCKQ